MALVSKPNSTVSVWRRLLREPLVQFGLLGLLAWPVIALQEPNPTTTAPRVESKPILSLDAPERRQAMLAQAQKELGREPTPEELERALSRDVDRDILIREAQKLGLNQGDRVIGDRLVQKVEFVLAGDIPPPSEAQLKAFHAAHKPYRETAKYAFTEIRFTSPDAKTKSQLALERLAKGETPESVGGRIARIRGASRLSLQRRLPKALFNAVLSAKPAVWSTVVVPGATVLLRVNSVEQAAPLAYEKMANRVKDDWLKFQRQQAVDKALVRLRQSYGVSP